MSALHKPVLLHSLTPPLDVPEDRIYFTFRSGQFAYDCAGCNANCCKGYGYHLHAGAELDTQLTRNPSVRLFLDRNERSPAGQYDVRNCPPGCFFLKDDGRCGIQAEHGYAAKPETCRLFPFNYLRLIGSYLVVAPHLSLCPLQIAPPEVSSPFSDHRNLLADMAGGGIRVDVPEARSLIDEVDALIALERRIVQRSERHAAAGGSYEAFVAAQIEETGFLLPHDGTAAVWPSASNLDEFSRALSALLGVTLPATDREAPALVRTMLAVTAIVRAQLVLRKKDQGPPPGVVLERVPYVLLTLHHLAACAYQAGMKNITYQTVLRLYTQYEPLLTMLAHLDCEMVWDPSTNIGLPFADSAEFQSRYLRIARALLPREQRARRATWGQILREHSAEEPMARLTFLKALARHLAGRIVPAGAPHRSTRRTWRGSVQRWALGHLSHRALLTVAASQHKPRPVAQPAS